MLDNHRSASLSAGSGRGSLSPRDFSQMAVAGEDLSMLEALLQDCPGPFPLSLALSPFPTDTAASDHFILLVEEQGPGPTKLEIACFTISPPDLRHAFVCRIVQVPVRVFFPSLM